MDSALRNAGQSPAFRKRALWIHPHGTQTNHPNGIALTNLRAVCCSVLQRLSLKCFKCLFRPKQNRHVFGLKCLFRLLSEVSFSSQASLLSSLSNISNVCFFFGLFSWEQFLTFFLRVIPQGWGVVSQMSFFFFGLFFWEQVHRGAV